MRVGVAVLLVGLLGAACASKANEVGVVSAYDQQNSGELLVVLQRCVEAPQVQAVESDTEVKLVTSPSDTSDNGKCSDRTTVHLKAPLGNRVVSSNGHPVQRLH